MQPFFIPYLSKHNIGSMCNQLFNGSIDEEYDSAEGSSIPVDRLAVLS